MPKVVYRPPREKLKTPKTESDFTAEKPVKKAYHDWSKEELIAEIERLKKRKKFGLVWEPKDEKVVEECRDKLPVLREAKEKEIITDKDKSEI